MNNDQRMQEISEVQAKYIDELMRVPHVVPWTTQHAERNHRISKQIGQ